MRIQLVDWIILIVLTGGLLGVGWWTKRFTKGVADFTVANRKLRMWLGLSASSADGIAVASIVMLGEEAFTRGFCYAWLVMISLFILLPLVGIWGIGIKRFRATGVQTLPQYYEMRFSKGVRILAGVAIGLGGVLNLAVFPIISSEFLSVFLGFPKTFMIGSMTIETAHAMMLFIIGLSLVFVTSGGFVTVIATNYVQSVIMAIGIFVISYICIKQFASDSISGFIFNIHDTIYNARGEGGFNFFKGGGYGVVFFIWYVGQRIYGVLAFPPSLVMPPRPGTHQASTFSSNINPTSRQFPHRQEPYL